MIAIRTLISRLCLVACATPAVAQEGAIETRTPLFGAPVAAPATPEAALEAIRLPQFLVDGGPVIWAISVLSIVTLAIILWKTWGLARAGAWRKGHAREAVAAYERGDRATAEQILSQGGGPRSTVVRAAVSGRATKPDALAREDTLRVARNELAEAATGLRALELIATIAPLLGLLGTVLGMIAAFQALQDSGARADPGQLAGGIWEALLTTAAGMAVAIPASAALTWFEAVIDRMRRDIEDAVTRIFVARPPEEAADLARAAE